MSRRLQSFLDRHPLAAALVDPLLVAREKVLLGSFLPDSVRIARDFRRSFSRTFPADNPQTLNEKLSWMKLHVRDPLQTVAADKFAAREWVADRIGTDHLIPLLGAWDRPSQVPFDTLPSAFVLKVNHGSGQNLIVRDKAALDLPTVRRQLALWLRQNHYALSAEWPYKDIPPKILAEPLLLSPDGTLPLDFKLHCFAGHVEFIQVDIARETRHLRNFYSRDWDLLPFLWCERLPDGSPAWPNGPAVPRPFLLPDLIRLAETLASPWPYVRTDFYLHDNRVLFGELTFYHGSALEHFYPSSFDLTFGHLINLRPNPPNA